MIAHSARDVKPLAATKSLGGRLALLVEKVHGGSVLAAANAVGVPNSTLSRIVAGKAANPRAAVLRSLAAYYRTSIDWLLTGEGAAPEALESNINEVALSWWQLLDSLNLPPKIGDVIRDLPNVGNDFARLALRGVAIPRPLGESLIAAADYDYRAWIRRFDGVARELGRSQLRDICIRYYELARVRYALPLLPEESAALDQERVAIVGAKEAEEAAQYWRQIRHHVSVETAARVLAAQKARAQRATVSSSDSANSPAAKSVKANRASSKRRK